MESLDTILSGREAASADKPNEEVTQQVEGESQQQTEGTTQEGEQGQIKTVPHEALHAEKQKVKRYTEEVVDLRRSNETLQRQIAEVLQRVPLPKQEAAPKPDWFENPELATRTEVQSTVSPQFEQFNQRLMAIAKDTAIGRFTEGAVSEAEEAFNKAAADRTIDPEVHAKINNSPNPWAAAVQWHQQQKRAQLINDPKVSSVLEKIGADPSLVEKFEAFISQPQEPEQQPAQQRQPVMPNNFAGVRNVGTRNGPAWSGPQPLTNIFATRRGAG